MTRLIVKGLLESLPVVFQRAISIFEGLEKFPQVRTVRTMADLGAVYTVQGRYEDAESTLRRGLDIVERGGGTNSSFAALYYSYLGKLYIRQGKLTDAEPAVRRALSIREPKGGGSDDDIAYSLDDLGRVMRLQGDGTQAEPLIRRALASREKILPAGHPLIADPLDNLAELYTTQGKYGDAEVLYVRALQIREKALPGDHPDAIVLEHYSVLLRQTNREPEANAMGGRAQAIRQNRSSQGQ